jgi:NTE family protein
MATGSMVIGGGKNSALVNYELGYSFDDKAPLERWFRLGGLGRLSGLIPLQLTGRHFGLATLAYYRRLNEFELLQAYAGATIEAGNVWDYSADIGLDDLLYSASLFFGANTPLGPVYLAWGYHESGDSTIYFYVGNPFRISRFD